MIHNDLIDQVVFSRDQEEIEAQNDPPATGQKNEAVPKTVSVIVPITVDFGELCALSPDVVGWIYCENTMINYPIVQGDDNVYYLDHFLNGEHSRSGTPFVDYRCSSDFTDTNTLLYGHHMKDGSMFASILGYQSQEYYDEHPVMYILTPTQNYVVNVFSGYVTDPDSESFTIWFESEAEYENHLITAAQKSNFKSNVTATSEDKLITLSTCSYEYTNARFVVHAIITILR